MLNFQVSLRLKNSIDSIETISVNYRPYSPRHAQSKSERERERQRPQQEYSKLR